MVDILSRITNLRNERNWSEYQLAENSGLTQSTISSWYRKNILPTIPSLNKICDAFGITMSQFFLENGEKTVVLNDEQLSLLNSATKLNPKQFHILIEFLNSL